MIPLRASTVGLIPGRYKPPPVHEARNKILEELEDTMMTQTIPMTNYRSVVTPPPKNAPPAKPKPAANLVRMQQLMALGHQPAAAMAMIEQADGHTGRIPPSTNAANSGGRGQRRPSTLPPRRTRILAYLTREWITIDEAMVEAIGCDHQKIRATMRDLLDMGSVEQIQGKGKTRSKWRLPK